MTEQWDRLTFSQQVDLIVEVLTIMARADATQRGLRLDDLTGDTSPELHHDPGTYRLVWPNGLDFDMPADVVAQAVAIKLDGRNRRRDRLN